AARKPPRFALRTATAAHMSRAIHSKAEAIHAAPVKGKAKPAPNSYFCLCFSARRACALLESRSKGANRENSLPGDRAGPPRGFVISGGGGRRKPSVSGGGGRPAWEDAGPWARRNPDDGRS